MSGWSAATVKGSVAVGVPGPFFTEIVCGQDVSAQSGSVRAATRVAGFTKVVPTKTEPGGQPAGSLGPAQPSRRTRLEGS